MRKVLSFLAIVATVVGMSTMVFAKSFSDVKNTKYNEAVDFLSDLNIVSGYEDGKYKPNNSVKRSEMAKLLIVAMGKESSADYVAGDTNFSDVKGHWASGYINLASSLGLIKGYPDGTFRPDATVSYVEASTMLLRALNYGKELDNLSWPTGYMEKANSAGLLKNVSAKNSSEAAIRGNIASMVFNTLKANTRKVINSNNTGNVYGDGVPLMEKAFKDYMYINDGIVIDIDLTDEVITIEDEKNKRDITVYYSDDSTIKKLFGRKVSCIYNEDTEELISFEISDNQNVKVVFVDEISDDIIFSDKDEYEILKETNVLFLNISRYSEVEKAYMVFDKDNDIEYVAFEGTPTIYIGMITDKDLKLENGRKGFEIRNIDSDYKELELANQSQKLTIGDVVLYALNNDDEAIIYALEDANDADVVEAVSKSSIELVDEDKVSFDEDEEFKVYFVKDSHIYTGELEDVEAGFDKASVLKIGEIYHIIVFEDSVAEEDIITNVSASTARKELKKLLTTANKKKNKETSYSVVSFEAFRDALTYAQSVYDSSSSSAARLQLATKDLQETYAGLKTVTTADKELRAAFSNLKTKIANAEKLVAADYTSASYQKLATALANAKKITIETTTVAKITTAINNLTSATNLLVTNASANQIVEATNRLSKAISDAKAINQSNYTSESYEVLRLALTAANNVDRTTAGARELNNVAGNLEAAIDGLVSHEQKAYNDAKVILDKTLAEAKGKNESAYTPESWSEFKKIHDEVLAAYTNIKNLNSNQVKELNTKLVAGIGKLVLKTEATLKANSINTIKMYINRVKTYNETTWNATNPTITWAAINEKINNAQKSIYEADKHTGEQLQKIAMDLMTNAPTKDYVASSNNTEQNNQQSSNSTEQNGQQNSQSNNSTEQNN